MTDIITDHRFIAEQTDPMLFDELTPAIAARAKEAAETLAAKGAEQHFAAIDEVRNRLSDIASQSEVLEVTLRDASDLMGKDTMCHAVALTELDPEGLLVEHHQDVAIVTALEYTSGTISYRTKAKTLLGDMLYDLFPERVIGATVV